MIKKGIRKYGGKKMKKCVECGKNVGFFQSYRHPVRGKDYYICNDCYDKISASVDQYREFISNNSFNTEPTTIDIKKIYGDFVSKVQHAKQIFKTNNNRINISKH
jgi:hypothetical protein